jgi:hypothetical protein
MSNEIKRKFPLKLDLQLFAEPVDPLVDPEPPIDPPKDPPKKLELTQEEFDAKIAERLARERKKYADYDEVKAKLAGYDTAEDERKKAAMSEKERLEAEKAEALQKAEESEAGRVKAVDSANQRIIRTEFRLLAKEAGVRADALNDAYVLADKSTVNVDDDGNVGGLTEVIDALLKRNRATLAAVTIRTRSRRKRKNSCLRRRQRKRGKLAVSRIGWLTTT